MGRFVCFWNGTKLMVVLLLTGCVSMMASVQYPQPSQFSLQGGQLKLASNEQKKDLFSTYCSGGKQIRSLTLNFSFLLPPNPKGWPIDKVGTLQRELNKKQQCLHKRIFYYLGEQLDCNFNHFSHSSGNLQGEKLCAPTNRSVPVWRLSSTKNAEEIESIASNLTPIDNEYPSPLLIRSHNGKLISLYSISPNSNEVRFLSHTFDSTSSFEIPELNALIDRYTILEPIEYQTKAYSEDADSPAEENSLCELPSAESVTFFKDGKWETIQAFAIGEDGNPSASAALYQRSRIWERYIARFSTVKESADATNANKINTQVSLDLNGFCRYGRSTDDLTSK